MEKKKYFRGGINLELKEIRKLALDNELSINYILKDLEISKIFKILDSKLKNTVLKGGTGINRVYLKKENRRFSEDIDFDIYSKEDINIVKEKLHQILKEQLKEYIVEKPRIMNETIRFDVYYTGIQKDKIKLEFKLNKGIIKNTTQKIVDYGFVPSSSAIYTTYDLEELINQKLLAFVNRTDGKDAYDLYYLLQLEHNKQKIKKELINKSKEKILFLLSDKKQIRYLENSINHYISKSKRQSFVGLLQELLNLI